MYIGLDSIRSLFPGAQSFLRNSESTCCLTGWMQLDNSPFTYVPHLLYVCEHSEALADISYLPGMHILCIVREDEDLAAVSKVPPLTVNTLLLKNIHSEELYSELYKMFNTQCGVGLFADTLLDILFSDGGIQTMIEKAFAALRNPIFVFDSSFNLIAANWAEAKQTDTATQLIENKGFTADEFRMANSRGHIHEKMLKSETPIMAYNHELGYDQILCTIDTKKDLGHIVISATHRPFNPIDSHLLLVLKKCIDQQMKKDEFVRNSKGFHYEYFLKDLLDGKIATSKSFYDRLGYVKNEFSGNMCCLVIETARSSTLLNAHLIRALLENRISGTKTLMYNGEIIAILSMPKNQPLPKAHLDAAKVICKENDLYAGLSNAFTDILEISEYYKQALRAIELGICSSDKPGLFLYEDYYLEHVKNIFIQKESSETFFHPKMKTLFEYDRAHGSELAYTLYMYLTCERSIAAASEEMHMHRNSVVYRMRKIESLIGDDFGSYRERQYLILSYEMNNEHT